MKNSNSDFEQVDGFDLKDELTKYLYHWKWFVLSIIISYSLVHVYLRYVTPIYQASASIMIKDNQKSGISDELKAVSDLGIVGTGSVNNTDNEIEVIKSRKIIGRAIDSLNLCISYFRKGRIKTTDIYGYNPIKLKFLEEKTFDFKKDTTVIIKIKNLNEYDLLDFEGNVIKTKKFNDILNSPNGKFKISNLSLNENFFLDPIVISINKRDRIIDSYRSRVSIEPISSKSSVLTLKISDANKQKAKDFLNTLIDQYNFDAINDKNEVSKKTIDFINDRLDSVFIDLANIQDSVKIFKVKNNITGLSTESSMLLEDLKNNYEKLSQLKFN